MFIVSYYFPAENRWGKPEWFPTYQCAYNRADLLSKTFVCDVYISELKRTIHRSQ